MSDLQKDPYSASCNPPRRAKRVPVVEPTHPSHPHTLLPMSPTLNSTIPDILPTSLATTPAKRGRKPGPLSRSAREAQRRLNHSIIEKARRTKINDALATLRQLVPVNYGSSQVQQDDDYNDDEEEEDYPEGTRRSKPKPKATGKREEKEKEFKLEILVRTVSFLQDLLKRVDTMENTVCQHCGASRSCKKRRHAQLYDIDEDDQSSRQSKVVRTEEHTLKPHTSPIPESPCTSPISNSHSSPVPQSHSMGSPANGGTRLPSISSWLPDVPIDPTLLSPQSNAKSSPKSFPYLPSPPSSTFFAPVRTSQVPPVLNLGPVATAAMVALPPHTSEDESAASLLLQIATSPPFRPSVPTPTTTTTTTTTTVSNYNLLDPSKFSLDSDVRNQRVAGHVCQAKTPRSLLGLHRGVKY